MYAGYPVFAGSDLGLTYTKNASAFRIWSPTAEAARILLYDEGKGGEATQTLPLLKGEQGSWYILIPGDLKNTYYTYQVWINGVWSKEITDPYARAVGINGRRAMVIDLEDTDPSEWQNDKSPQFSPAGNVTDAVIYELQIRDASIHAHSGIRHKGKFLGLAENGTVNEQGLATGLDHLKELGVTHVHLLPFYDFNSIDESLGDSANYNWGYDPINYNVPEGSFSTDPYQATARIKELKTMIAALHQNGLRVVMDVVYNHTALTDSSSFNLLVPGYYYRHKADGSFSDATACGNETASEMPMMRKFIIESVLYWVKEFHIDGFRFDLMGVHDIRTMNEISAALLAVNPGILIYGEGWTAGASPLPGSMRAIKANASRLAHIAVFSDDIRDGIKGSVFDVKQKGFIAGNSEFAESVKFGIVAACKHPQINYRTVNYSKAPYASSPQNVVSYADCHDNNTLWDKINLSNPQASLQDKTLMQQLALTIVLTSQGIPFLHAGSEFMRSKKGVENSYNSPDSINAIDWNLKTVNHDLFKYVSKLIQLRKEHPCFRMATAQQVSENIHFEKGNPAGTIVYTINGAAVKDNWKKTWIALNGTAEPVRLKLPPGKWKAAMQGTELINQGAVVVGRYNSLILYLE